MSFERKQFTFYRSFYEAMQKLPAKKREKLAMFIIEYALNETEPDTKDATLLATFAIIRPILDSGRIKAQAGKIGGSASGEARKANPKQNKANPKQEKEQEQVQEQVQGEEQEQEQGLCFPRETKTEGFPEVLMALRIVGVELRNQERADAERLFAQYGKQEILDAIDRAKEANVPRWSYIRAIVVSGGVGPRGGNSRSGGPKGSYIHHDDPPSPAMLAAVREMLAEDFGEEEDVTADKQGLSLHGEHDAPEQEGKA